jgi:hypothetical protein
MLKVQKMRIEKLNKKLLQYSLQRLQADPLMVEMYKNFKMSLGQFETATTFNGEVLKNQPQKEGKGSKNNKR